MEKKRTQSKGLLILAGCILLLGCILLSYTAISDWYNQKHQSEICAEYNEMVNNLDDEQAKEELRRAALYNHQLTKTVSTLGDPFMESVVDASAYDSLLNFTLAGVMAYVEIPKINVLLPIYHGVGTDILTKGIGHLPETSLPVGGVSTHCVLAGHSGMSYAKLFTDLPKLELGDVFYIHVYNRTMTYTVDQIKTVLPSNTSDLKIVPGEDYVTLVTCTPYGVNSHRLLVRGTRTA